MTVSTEQLMQALRQVPEPCSIAMRRPIDICEMGLVESVEIDGGRVAVTLVLTDPSCVHFLAMRRYIVDVLSELDGVDEVAVTMSTTQLWTSDRMVPRSAPA